MCSSMCGSRLAASKAAPPSPLGCFRSPASKRSQPVVVGPMRRLMKPLRPLWRTAPTSGDRLAEEEPRRARARGLSRALGRASQVLDLVYYHENSVEDCALILNIPVATVKTRMFYARKKLAALVQDA